MMTKLVKNVLKNFARCDKIYNVKGDIEMKKGDFKQKKLNEGCVKRSRVVAKLAAGLATLGLFAGAMTLVGCGPTDTPDPIITNPPVVDPSIPTEQIDALLDKMKDGNYTYYENGDTLITYKIDDGNVEVDRGYGDHVIHVKDDEESYDLVYDNSTSLWIKSEATDIDIDTLIYDDLVSATWTDYDKEGERFIGTVAGEPVKLYIRDDDIYIYGEKLRRNVLDIGTTEIEMPRYEEIIKYDHIPEDEINAFIERMREGNYTLEVNGRSGDAVYYVNVDNLFIVPDNQEENGYYYIVEDGKSYRLDFNTNDNKWHKTEAEEIDVDNLILNGLETATWTNIDYINGTIYGILNDDDVALVLGEDRITIDGNVNDYEVYDVGSTNITLPDASLIVNESEITPPPVDEDEEIYTIDQDGNKVFDTETIVKALNADVGNGQTWFEKFYNEGGWLDGHTLIKLAYVQPSAGELQFGVLEYVNDNPVKRFLNLYYDENQWQSFLADDSKNNISDFKALLETNQDYLIRRGDIIQYEYSTEDGTPEQVEAFTGLTESALDRLTNVGVQASILEEVGEKHDVENADILLGFKTETRFSPGGFDLGTLYYWNQYYLWNNNGNVEFVRIGAYVNSASEEQAVEYIINNKDRKWLIGGYDNIPIDNGNLALYNEQENVNAIENYSAQKPVSYVEKKHEEKEREL